MIEITGYVTQSHGRRGFTIKIINDNVEDEKGEHPQVSKEKKIEIARLLYPDRNYERYEKIQEGSYEYEQIGGYVSISKELKKGDRVKCCVFIVTTTGNDFDHNKTYNIQNNPNDIENYTKFRLFLNPDSDSFERLEVDTPETLKYRKQNYYMDTNTKKCEKITGNSYQYTKAWWINKNPKIIFPILGWIKVRANASNLWKRLIKQNNLTIALIISNILLALITIWSLFFKSPQP